MSFLHACVLLGRVLPASQKVRPIPITFEWMASCHVRTTILKARAAVLCTGTLFGAAVATSAAQGVDAAPPSHYGDGTSLNLSLLQQIVADHNRSFVEKRREMVHSLRRQLHTAAPAVEDDRVEAVLSVIGAVPREEFVPRPARPYAYLPTPLKIGYNQTISDAYIVAVMTVELQLPLNAEVLDVGTGSGYQAAVLSPLVRRVYSIEIVKPLADAAAKRLRHLGYRNVEVRAGDGFAGWSDHAPFDAIVVAAGASAVPQPLLDQLKPGGRLVMPVGPTTHQEQLLVIKKGTDGSLTRCSLGWTMFVPLTGRGMRSSDNRDLPEPGISSCHGAYII